MVQLRGFGDGGGGEVQLGRYLVTHVWRPLARWARSGYGPSDVSALPVSVSAMSSVAVTSKVALCLVPTMVRSPVTVKVSVAPTHLALPSSPLMAVGTKVMNFVGVTLRLRG